MIGPDLRVRVISGLVMALAAVASEIAGGWWFSLFWTAVFAAVAVEWQRIIGPDPDWHRSIAACSATILAGLLFQYGLGLWSGIPLLLAAVFCSVRLPQQRFLAAIGLGYAGLPLLTLIWLRSANPHGMELIVWIFSIVWSADILAYFVGRSLGGPKLWPSISPKKTWSGFAGGTLGSALVAGLMLIVLGVPANLGLVLVAVALAILSAGGDLFESALKRRFGVKDASNLIPGHGGAMDRVDGFVAVLLGAAIIVIVRGGDPGQALLVW